MIPTSASVPEGTLGQAILRAAELWPDRPFFEFQSDRLSFAAYRDRCLARARDLLALGVGPGAHVGILMPNCTDYLVTIDAAALIGACAVTLNTRYRGTELRHAVVHGAIEYLVYSDGWRTEFDLRQLICHAIPSLTDSPGSEELQLPDAPSLRAVAVLDPRPGETWLTGQSLSEHAAGVNPDVLSARLRAVAPSDPALIIFSSGTTSAPKGCVASHSMVTTVAKAMTERFALTEADVFWDPLPMYHLSSILPVIACRCTGASYITQVQFDADEAMDLLERRGVTIAYPAFPTIMAALTDHPDFARRDLTRIRMMLNIGAPDLLRKFAAALPGATQICCYGMTEGGGICTVNRLTDPLEKRVATVGNPLECHTIRIVDPETLKDMPQGERGEIWIGGAVFSGYFNDPEKTAETLVDGFCHTGDLGWIDEDGRLIYSGRLKDMLKIGGENVAAVEIESFLMRHPAIKMAQVTAVPDDRLTEVAAAFIELAAGAELTPEEVVAFCEGEIASFKIPRYVRFVTEWPMSSTKIQKFKLPRDFDAGQKIERRKGPAAR